MIQEAAQYSATPLGRDVAKTESPTGGSQKANDLTDGRSSRSRVTTTA